MAFCGVYEGGALSYYTGLNGYTYEYVLLYVQKYLSIVGT